ATEKSCVVEGRPDFCHPKFYPPQPNALFRNDGGGRFTDVSRESGIAAHAGKGMAATVADFDGDGYTDIFVTNDRSFNFLFHNDGRGHFQEIAFEAGVAAPANGNPPSAMGTDAQDFDGDGRPDLVYTALRDETFPLYRNQGREFADVGSATRLAVLTRPMAGWGVVWADLDNDGWKDLVTARGDVLSVSGAHGARAREPLSWFRNGAGTGGRRFSAESFPGAPMALYRGVVAADFDNDGCLDVVATSLQEAARVFRNPCATGQHWLKVDVRVLGARVRVDGQWRHVTSAVGYAASYAGPLHFGVGEKKSVEVEVFWPGGGAKRLAEVPVDQVLVVRP
ncbi:MAG: CRTAC1 family protein, partial [Acidobacteria bacterium]|nr:CRTAC1 family protein [Acidobacteriota bacterium]